MNRSWIVHLTLIPCSLLHVCPSLMFSWGQSPRKYLCSHVSGHEEDHHHSSHFFLQCSCHHYAYFFINIMHDVSLYFLTIFRPGCQHLGGWEQGYWMQTHALNLVSTVSKSLPISKLVDNTNVKWKRAQNAVDWTVWSKLNQLQICYLFRHCHVIAAYSNF